MTTDCGTSPGDRQNCLAVPTGVTSLSDYTNYSKYGHPSPPPPPRLTRDKAPNRR